MPISVLLIEDDREHARALVDALVDPWLGWRVEVAPSLAQAQAWLETHTPDILLVCQHFEDGSAYDVLERMGRIPALIIVDAGADAQAAHAMRHGFADFTIRDPGCNYLLALPAQIEAVLERSSSVRARRAAEAMLARQHRLLQAISRAQAVFMPALPRALRSMRCCTSSWS